jgi:hypothetical protein
MTELLTDREIINFLRTLRHDKYFKYAQKVPIDSLCQLVGLSRQTVTCVGVSRCRTAPHNADPLARC